MSGADNDLVFDFSRTNASGLRGSRAYFGTSVCHTDIAARVTLLRELASKEVVELGLEDTVSDELALLRDLARHLE